MKKAAIDFGLKRTGIAFTDLAEKIVARVQTVETSNISDILRENLPLSEILMGFPINLKMKFTRSTYSAIDKAIEIAEIFAPIPLYLMDERFTTTMAYSLGKKENVDGISASILLNERLNGAKGRRVFWSLPRISEKIISLVLSLNAFKNVIMIGSALRGLERYDIGDTIEIFEEDPAFFRLREKVQNEKCYLNFGMNWDIILQRINEVDLVICGLEEFEEICRYLPKDLVVIVEGEGTDEAFSIGERWLTVKKII